MAEFEDGKDKSALRTIGEVSDALGIKQHVLRYWEQQFSLLKPLKRSGGRRYYRTEDIALVEQIDRLVNEEGYTLKGAEAVLRSVSGSSADRRKFDRRASEQKAEPSGDGPTPPASPRSAPDSDREETIAQLKTIRARLAKAIEA